MIINPKLWPWIIVSILAAFAVYSISGILLPFIASIFVAYALNPAVTKLESWRIPRAGGATLMVMGFFIIFGGLFVLAIPFLKNELVRLASSVPEYGQRAFNAIIPTIDLISEYIMVEDLTNLRESASSYIGDMISWSFKLLANLLTNTLALANLISLIILTPIIAFYLLRDWPNIVQNLKNLLPRDQSETIIEQANHINVTLGGYVRGQSTVCLIQAFVYSLGLYFVGLDFAITIGIVTGLLSFIPYVGMLIGVGAGIGVALAQFSDWTSIGLVALVFTVGSFFEGHFLTPNLVGDRIGLHPVWVIFALLAGGSLFGFLGMMLSLPVAATLGVLMRFFIQLYLDSSWYHGKDSGNT